MTKAAKWSLYFLILKVFLPCFFTTNGNIIIKISIITISAIKATFIFPSNLPIMEGMIKILT